MKDSEFLYWLVDRIVNIYKENPNVDFVLKLKSLASRQQRREEDFEEELRND